MRFCGGTHNGGVVKCGTDFASRMLDFVENGVDKANGWVVISI